MFFTKKDLVNNVVCMCIMTIRSRMPICIGRCIEKNVKTNVQTLEANDTEKFEEIKSFKFKKRARRI